MGEQQLNAHWRQVALGGNTGPTERHAKPKAARVRILVAAAAVQAGRPRVAGDLGDNPASSEQHQ